MLSNVNNKEALLDLSVREVDCCCGVLLVRSLLLLQTDKKDPQGTTSVAGFEVLLQKQLKGKQMQKEMAEFIHERYSNSVNVR